MMEVKTPSLSLPAYGSCVPHLCSFVRYHSVRIRPSFGTVGFFGDSFPEHRSQMPVGALKTRKLPQSARFFTKISASDNRLTHALACPTTELVDRALVASEKTTARPTSLYVPLPVFAATSHASTLRDLSQNVSICRRLSRGPKTVAICRERSQIVATPPAANFCPKNRF
jgi:hypothetical protein